MGSYGLPGGKGGPGEDGFRGEDGLDGTDALNVNVMIKGDCETLHVSTDGCDRIVDLGGINNENVVFINCRGGDGGHGGRGGNGTYTMSRSFGMSRSYLFQCSKSNWSRSSFIHSISDL